MNRLAAALVGSFLCCAVSAQAEPPVVVSGFDDMSCGAWSSSASNPTARAQYLAWFRGFITGVNYSNPQLQIPLERLPSNETMTLYVDKYCRDNPLSIFPGAAFALVKDLRK
jgi:hypothetical protein